jgi:hypothetical protein
MKEPEISTEELRRAMLYLADAVLQLTRTVDLMAMRIRNIENPSDPNHPIRFREFAEAAWAAQDRVRAAVDLLVKSDESPGTK